MLVPKPPAPSLPSSARLAGGGRWDPGAIRTPAPPPMLVQQQMAEPQPMPQPAAEQLPPLLLLGDELLGLLLSSPAAGGAAGLLATRDLLSLRGACWSLRDRGQVEVAADLLAGRLAVEFSSAAAVRPRRRPAAVARLLCTCIWIVREKERERGIKGCQRSGKGRRRDTHSQRAPPPPPRAREKHPHPAAAHPLSSRLACRSSGRRSPPYSGCRGWSERSPTSRWGWRPFESCRRSCCSARSSQAGASSRGWAHSGRRPAQWRWRQQPGTCRRSRC